MGLHRPPDLPLLQLAPQILLGAFAQLVEGGAPRVGDDDLLDAGARRLADHAVEGVDHLIPEADVGAQDHAGAVQLGLGELLEAGAPRLQGHAVDLGVQVQVGEDLGVGIDAHDLGAVLPGAVDAEEPPAAADLHHPGAGGQALALEEVHDQVAAVPEPVAVDLRLVVLLQGPHPRMGGLEDGHAVGLALRRLVGLVLVLAHVSTGREIQVLLCKGEEVRNLGIRPMAATGGAP